MPHARQYSRNTTEASAGTHLDSDLDLLFAWDTAHDAGGRGAGVSAHGIASIVGTTDPQTLTNKTLTSPVLNTVLNLGLQYEALAAGSATITTTTVIAGVTALAADVTVTLPSAEIAKVGRIFYIKDEVGTCGNAYKITVATAGAETIDGQASIDIVENYGSLKLYSNGTNLFTIPD